VNQPLAVTVLRGGTGSEVMRGIAAPMVGGMIAAPLHLPSIANQHLILEATLRIVAYAITSS
jgi:Cu/Ag efflux pump CusA